MTKPSTLLAVAEHLMREHEGELADHWSQADVLLVRQAIEDALQLLCSRHSFELAACPNWRAKFLCAGELLGDEELARRALATWSALSRACHHLDYDLPPTAGELDMWIAEARRFVEAVESSDDARRVSGTH